MFISPGKYICGFITQMLILVMLQDYCKFSWIQTILGIWATIRDVIR